MEFVQLVLEIKPRHFQLHNLLRFPSPRPGQVTESVLVALATHAGVVMHERVCECTLGVVCRGLGLYWPGCTRPLGANQLLFATRFRDRFWNEFLMIYGSLLDLFFMIFYVFSIIFRASNLYCVILDFGVNVSIIFDVFLDTFAVRARNLPNLQKHLFLQ